MFPATLLRSSASFFDAIKLEIVYLVLFSFLLMRIIVHYKSLVIIKKLITYY